jgi:hypothetical protein
VPRKPRSASHTARPQVPTRRIEGAIEATGHAATPTIRAFPLEGVPLFPEDPQPAKSGCATEAATVILHLLPKLSKNPAKAAMRSRFIVYGATLGGRGRLPRPVSRAGLRHQAPEFTYAANRLERPLARFQRGTAAAGRPPGVTLCPILRRAPPFPGFVRRDNRGFRLNIWRWREARRRFQFRRRDALAFACGMTF